MLFKLKVDCYLFNIIYIYLLLIGNLSYTAWLLRDSAIMSTYLRSLIFSNIQYNTLSVGYGLKYPKLSEKSGFYIQLSSHTSICLMTDFRIKRVFFLYWLTGPINVLLKCIGVIFLYWKVSILYDSNPCQTTRYPNTLLMRHECFNSFCE